MVYRGSAGRACPSPAGVGGLPCPDRTFHFPRNLLGWAGWGRQAHQDPLELPGPRLRCQRVFLNSAQVGVLFPSPPLPCRAPGAEDGVAQWLTLKGTECCPNPRSLRGSTAPLSPGNSSVQGLGLEIHPTWGLALPKPASCICLLEVRFLPECSQHSYLCQLRVENFSCEPGGPSCSQVICEKGINNSREGWMGPWKVIARPGFQGSAPLG